MKIIDLLNKIANGEEVPKKIMWKDELFDNDVAYFLYEYIGDCSNKDIKLKLNCNVDIIEEDKKIEKIDNAYYHKTQPEQNQIFQRKINKIIDKINSLEKKQ